MCLGIKDGKYFHLEHKELISTFDIISSDQFSIGLVGW